MNNEPVAVGAAVVGFFNALIAALAYVYDLEQEAVVVLNALAVALVSLTAAVVRSKVSPVQKS